MKAQILKLAGVKNDSDFYQKFPTEKSFMAKHGAALKKAQMGIKQPKQMPINIASPNLTAIDPIVSNIGKGLGKFASSFGGISDGLKNMDAGAIKGLASGVASGVGGIIAGFDQLKEEKKQIANTNMWGQVSDVVAAADGSRPQATKRKHTRPEDQMVENLNPVGVAGDSFLQAKDGKKIKKAKSGVAQILGGVGSAASAIPGIGTVASIALPLLGDVYDMFVPDKNAEELKKKEEELAMNMGFANGQNAVANTFGQYSDSGSVGRNGLSIHNSMSEYRAGGHLQEYTPPSERTMDTDREQFTMGGELKTMWGGKAEPMSYNPYLPGTGETVMFKGQSHDETNSNGQSGIGVKYGNGGMTDYAEDGDAVANADVEVERNEPGTELVDPETGENNLVVYGNMKINKAAADHIGDSKSENMKYKNYIANLSKGETKANNTIQKAASLANEPNANSLALSTAEVMMKAGNLTLAKIADYKINAAEWQNATLEMAEKHGLESDALSQGKIKYAIPNDRYAEFGGSLEKAQKGKKVKPAINTVNKKGQSVLNNKNSFLPSTMFDINKSNYSDEVAAQNEWMGMGDKYPSRKLKPYNEQPMSRQRHDTMAFPEVMPVEGKSSAYLPNLNAQIAAARANQNNKPIVDDSGMSWENIAKTAYSSAYPFLRQKVTNPLDPSQYSTEMLAASLNQEEPVSVQSYSPMLTQPTRVSYQDQLNEITAQTRSAERMTPYNPEAASMIAGQAYGAKNKVLAEQFRLNQGEQARVAEQNRGALNEAQRFNIGQYDQQMVRTSEAKSKTKQQAIEIGKSLNEKIQQNRRETREANLMQNMYPGFNFTGSGVAYKDPTYLASLNMSGSTKTNNATNNELAPNKAFSFDENHKIIGTHAIKEVRNGALVKAIKNL